MKPLSRCALACMALAAACSPADVGGSGDALAARDATSAPVVRDGGADTAPVDRDGGAPAPTDGPSISVDGAGPQPDATATGHTIRVTDYQTGGKSDSEAIQAAIDAAAPGDTVLFSAGTYTLDKAVLFASDVDYRGAPGCASVLKAKSSAGLSLPTATARRISPTAESAATASGSGAITLAAAAASPYSAPRATSSDPAAGTNARPRPRIVSAAPAHGARKRVFAR